MAFMECHFHADVLGMASTMNVILPQASETQIGMASAGGERDAAPVLYLLHGLSDDHSIWMRRTSIERHAAPLGLAVIMPNVHRSFYTNMENGYRYWDFVSDELPQIVRSMFRVSDRREDTCVAGLSMGGYGAFKLALNQPERFAAAASLSGALDIGRHSSHGRQTFPHDVQLVFGERDPAGTPPDDLFACAEALANSAAPRPVLYQCCGTNDRLYDANTAFREHLQELGLDSVYSEEPAAHEWGYWDRQIQSFLDLIAEQRES